MKKAIAKLCVTDLGWGAEYMDAFNALQEQLQDVDKPAHQDLYMRLCVLSDASEAFWVASVTMSRERAQQIGFRAETPAPGLSQQRFQHRARTLVYVREGGLRGLTNA